MAGAPDLYVVCKNCQAEVSPYITECPYCGHRLRKRAPKLDREAAPRRERARRKPPAPPRLGRLRSGEMPGVRGDGRPWMTGLLVVIPALLTVLGKAAVYDPLQLVMLAGTQGDPWRPATTQLYYGSTMYEVVALAAIFLFGWLLERRHGHWAPLLVAVVGGAAGIGLVLLTDPDGFATGGNAIALALLAAWVVRDLRAARRGEEIDGDLLGVAAIAVVLVLVPAGVAEAHPLAGAGGGLAGLALGALLARRADR
ncbi:MAG TPA: rhomboid family intramembrane serine protease [Solirubrobacteraceae bacterium]|nr:rhomboid family intramembrane serine protease [Solirubrobacteraceae bacterium]